MRLYLVRHGDARSKQEDPERHLSAEGLAQVRRVAAFLRPLGLSVRAIWHSPKTRAAETAEVLASAVRSEEGLLERDDLAPKDDIGPVRRAVERSDDDLMIVGHLPMLGCLASRLVAGNESAGVVAMPTAAAVCLERRSEAGWQVAWMVTPQVLPGE